MILKKSKTNGLRMLAFASLLGIASMVSAQTVGVVEVGSSASKLQKLNGYGKDLPLITVLKQVVPSGWIVKKGVDKTIDTNIIVSWSSGNSWIEVLKEIGIANNLSFIVSWKNKTIHIDRVAKISDVMVDSTKTTQTNMSVTKSASIFEIDGPLGAEVNTTNTSVDVPVAKSVENNTWRWDINEDKTLMENVEIWARKAGFKLVWLGEDYKVPNVEGKAFGGAFDADNGPIKEISKKYGSGSRLKKPLSFQFWENNTLVVEDLEYDQTSFPSSMSNTNQ